MGSLDGQFKECYEDKKVMKKLKTGMGIKNMADILNTNFYSGSTKDLKNTILFIYHNKDEALLKVFHEKYSRWYLGLKGFNIEVLKSKARKNDTRSIETITKLRNDASENLDRICRLIDENYLIRNDNLALWSLSLKVRSYESDIGPVTKFYRESVGYAP